MIKSHQIRVIGIKINYVLFLLLCSYNTKVETLLTVGFRVAPHPGGGMQTKEVRELSVRPGSHVFKLSCFA